MTHPRISRAAPRSVQARTAADEPFSLDLTELDLRLLDLICGLRVVTQTQLERLHPDVPSRTVRYRTQRLHRLGLVGRTRPYRDSGSAPHHLWPTNRADALARGERPARRGERKPPNPLFLAHASALSELFVVLSTRVHKAGVGLLRFEREGEAREDFYDAKGQQRAIVPDARISLGDGARRLLTGNVELDLGTMTHARLRMKLRGFLAHAEWRADEGDPAPPPALLFVTTSPERATRFLEAAHRLQETERDAGQRLAIAACATAEELDQAVLGRCWRAAGDPRPLTLVESLRLAPEPKHLVLDLDAASA